MTEIPDQVAPPTLPPEYVGSWEIGWPRELFNKVKSDPRFPNLLNIARLRNMLRFVQGLVVFAPDHLLPTSRQRHTLNTFFLMNSLLIEAEHVVNGSAPHFRDFVHYDLIASAVRTPVFNDLLARVRQVRHQAVFHFDPEAAEQALKLGYFAEPPAFVPFLAGEGPRDFDVHACLAEQVPIELLIRDNERTDVDEAFRSWLDSASRLTTALLQAHDEFLAGMAGEFGAIHRQVQPVEEE
jgi:hypothetical protein